MARAADLMVATASPITSLLDNLVKKGFAVDQVSRFGMQPALTGRIQIRRGSYLLGCCGYAAAPLETLVGHFFQLMLNQLLGMKSVCVIASQLALKGCPGSSQAAIQQRTAEHLAIAKRFISVTGAQTEVVLDSSLNADSVELNVPEQRNLSTDLLRQVELEYFWRQHQLMEGVRQQLDVQLKSGWTVVDSAQKYEALVQAWIECKRPMSHCEAAFDALSIAIQRSLPEGAPALCYVYSPAAFTFCPQYPVAVPYAVRPTLDGQAAQRILLEKNQDLNRLIPDPKECSTRKAKERIVRAMSGLDRLVRMIDETVPNFFDQPRDEALDELECSISSGLRMWQQVVEAHGPKSRESHEQARLIKNQRIEHASALRTHLVPRLSRVLDVFGL